MAAGESIYDEIKEQQDKLKDAPIGEKIAYYIYYYKFHALAAICILAFIIYMLISILCRKENVFNLVVLNSNNPGASSSELIADFYDYAGIDSKKKEITVDSTLIISESENAFANEDAYYSVMKLSSMFAASQVDMMLVEEDMLLSYGREDTLYDLRALLSPALYNELSEKNLIQDITSSEGEQIPAGILVPESSVLYKTGYFDAGKRIFLCAVANTKQTENVEKFVEFIQR